MKIDYHIHSHFSSDSNLDAPSLISAAINKGYSEIAFTDHFDLLPSEIAVYGVPSYKAYSQTVKNLRNKFPGIKILKGVELGEYHRCHKLVDEIIFTDEEPDLIIASVHILPDGTNCSTRNQIPFTEKHIESYYLENLALAAYGHFDILGHLGIFKRYLTEEPEEKNFLDIVEEIFKQLIRQNIALEVNLSGLRNPLKKLIPSPELLHIYRQMGGELITIGSDSHHLDHFDAHYSEAIQRLSNTGFSYLAGKGENDWHMISIK
jgi:histidinol-phosphatase (PHP family)